MRHRLDTVGAALVVAAVAWTLTGARAAQDRPLPVVAGFLLAAGAFEAGRRLTAARGPEAAAAAAAALWLVHLALPELVKYPNADGAIDVQAILAGLLVVVAARNPRWRPWGAGLGFLALLSLVGSGSVFAAVSLGVAVVLVVTSHLTRHLAPAAVLVVVAVGGLIVVTAGAPLPERVLELETLAVRVDLWDEAALLLEAEPLRGVGPGRFEDVQTVSDDHDLRFAHSAPLQQGAEQGYPGMVLMLAVALWAVVRVAVPVSGRDRPAAGVALAALAALASHASVDFVLRFPLVFATAALVVGAGAAASAQAGAPAPGGESTRPASAAGP